MKNIYLIVLILLLFSCQHQPTEKQDIFDNFVKSDTSDIYEWNGVCCENRGVFNPKKFSRKQLDDTYKLIGTGLLVEGKLIFKPEDIETIDLNGLEQEYKTQKEKFEKLEVVPFDYWINLKKDRLREIDEQYEIERIEQIAFKDSSILLNNRFVNHCNKYVIALTTVDTSIRYQAWRDLIEEQKKHNGSPGRVQEEFNEQFNSTQRNIYAKIALLTFGWKNCAINLMFNVKEDGTAEEKYEKLFKQVDSNCEGCD